MDNEKILQFIAEKIEDTRVAIFYCHSKSILKIQNTVINTYKVDDTGTISFFINRPRQLVSQFEQEFPAGLNYFKKGKGYFLKIEGKARIINDPEELACETYLSPDELNSALTTHILLKVKIQKAEFYDNRFEATNLLVKKIKSVYSRLFDSAGAASASYDFNKHSPLQHFGF